MMTDSLFWLIVLLMAEFIVRVVIEIREARLTQQSGGIFAILRLIPLINDLVPLPENRREPVVGNFVKFHEEGHKVLRHSLLRNVYKVALLLLSLGVIAYASVEFRAPLWEAIVWLHLVAFPGRVAYHNYCWNQEFEADRYALGRVDRKIAKNALKELGECEIPHTKLFAMFYREHPTVVLRRQKLNLK